MSLARKQDNLSLSHTHTLFSPYFSCHPASPIVFHHLSSSFSSCVFTLFFNCLRKRNIFCCFLLNSSSVNTAGSSAFSGKPEGQEPEAQCVYLTVMVTVVFYYFQLDLFCTMTALLCEWLINDMDLTWSDSTVWGFVCLKRLIKSFSLHDWTLF